MATNTVKWTASTKLITTIDEHGIVQSTYRSPYLMGAGVVQVLRELRLYAHSAAAMPVALDEFVSIEIKFVTK